MSARLSPEPGRPKVLAELTFPWRDADLSMQYQAPLRNGWAIPEVHGWTTPAFPGAPNMLELMDGAKVGRIRRAARCNTSPIGLSMTVAGVASSIPVARGDGFARIDVMRAGV